MKKIYLGAALVLFLMSCKGTQSQTTKASSSDQDYKAYAELITPENLRRHLTVIASDEMEGRQTGSAGQKTAGSYLIDEYEKAVNGHPEDAENYYQSVTASLHNARRNLRLDDSEIIWALIEETDKKDENVVRSADYDHVGANNGE